MPDSWEVDIAAEVVVEVVSELELALQPEHTLVRFGKDSDSDGPPKSEHWWKQKMQVGSVDHFDEVALVESSLQQVVEKELQQQLEAPFVGCAQAVAEK